MEVRRHRADGGAIGRTGPRFGRAAFSLWGHKVARFTSPFALLTLLVASAVGAMRTPWVAALFLAQVLAYGLGVLGLAIPPVTRLFIPRLVSFFLIVNASIVVAWAYHLSGRRVVAWRPTSRC